MAEELKNNKCKPVFMCEHSENDPCEYYNSTHCFGAKDYCTSLVGVVNSMVVELTNLGVNVEKGKGERGKGKGI